MDIYFIQQIDNSRLVRMPDPRRRREQRVQLVAAVALFVLVFAYAWQRFAVTRLGYEIEAARQQSVQLEQWNQGLTLQEASLRDPHRIYGLAEADLGMQTAQPGQILALDAAPAGSGAAPVMAANQPQP
ncbi:MAG TPA: hypothetical protein VNE83_02015 [Terriglobales bacterium]|nr:hypothetical protein [Terriglobales bacterium]